jgi:general secretion pathway protein L
MCAATARKQCRKSWRVSLGRATEVPQLLALLLPEPGVMPAGAIRRWWAVDDGIVVDSGSEGGWTHFLDDAVGVFALAPAADAPVSWLALPGLTPLQAAAAARLQMADAALGQSADQHVAAGLVRDDGMVAVAAVSRGAMDAWLAQLALAEVSVRALVPVAALVPLPAEGRATRAVIGSEDVLRTATLSAATDPVIDPIRTAGLTVDAVDDAVVAEWLAGLAERVPLDLLTGTYAPRPQSALSPDMRRWLVRLTAALAVLTLAVPLVQAWQLARGTSAADARSVAAAAAVGAKGDDAAAAEAALDQMLAARGGGPLALSAPLGGLYQSLNDHPAVAVRTLGHASNGTLSVTLASPRIEDVNAVLKALQARGYTITAQPMQGSDGMQMGNVTIRAVP